MISITSWISIIILSIACILLFYYTYHLRGQIKKALEIAMRSGGIDGDHHKAWVIDQMIRELTDCQKVLEQNIDIHGQTYIYEVLDKSKAYRKWVRDHNAGENGPNTYEWDKGMAP